MKNATKQFEYEGKNKKNLEKSDFKSACVRLFCGKTPELEFK